MHILHIYKDYYPVLGGIENHLRDLSAGLAARGHRVTVLVTSLDKQTWVEQPLPGLTVIKAGRLLHAASTPLSMAMLRVARRLRPDVAHLQFPYPPGDLVYLALPERPPLVVTYQSDIVRQRNLLRLYGPLRDQTLNHAARIIASSPNYAASSPVLRHYAKKCVVVPLGIDAARFAHADEQQVAALQARYQGPLLLFVGRLRYYKGLHVLLDALPQLPASLLIAGTGAERERLGAQVDRLGLAERVHFLGDVADEDLPALYHAADIFVQPAHLRAEAFGLVLLEAMASGLPCISTELGTGTSYVNQHGTTGLVVPPNDPPALARALQALLASPALRRHYGANGRQRVGTLFTRERMLDGVEDVYRASAGFQRGGSGRGHPCEG